MPNLTPDQRRRWNREIAEFRRSASRISFEALCVTIADHLNECEAEIERLKVELWEARGNG